MYELFCRLCFWFPPSKLYLPNQLPKKHLILDPTSLDVRSGIVFKIFIALANVPQSHVWMWRDPITSSFGAIFKVILYLGGRCMENSCFRRRTARIFTNRGMMPHRPVLQSMKFVVKFAVWFMYEQKRIFLKQLA